MSLVSAELLNILRCPLCHADLEEDTAASALRCTQCDHRYPVIEGIPDMVVDAG